MSTYVEEKLAAPERTANTKARARLEQLLVRWGAPDDVSTVKPPDIIRIRQLGVPRAEVWRRVGPLERIKTLYELAETVTTEATTC